jgi:hypothetical protein
MTYLPTRTTIIGQIEIYSFYSKIGYIKKFRVAELVSLILPLEKINTAIYPIQKGKTKILTWSHLWWQKFLAYLSFHEFNTHLVILELEIPDDLNLKFVQFL